MIALETDGNGQLLLTLDEDGLSFLQSQLAHLASKKTDHLHFFSEEWESDGDLDAHRPSSGSEAVHHWKILMTAKKSR